MDPSANEDFFLWHTWFSDVFVKGGFDIVIGNPPYIKEYTNRAAFNGFRETSPYYQGKMDLWYGFACHGLDLLKCNGILNFIATSNWVSSAGASNLRAKIRQDSILSHFVDFGEQRRSSVAGLTEYPTDSVHEEWQVGDTVQLRTEPFEL